MKEKENIGKIYNSEKGVTLILLAITIIVLLIILGVNMNSLMGEEVSIVEKIQADVFVEKQKKIEI